MKEFKLKVLSQYRAFFGLLFSFMAAVVWLGQSFGHFEPLTRILFALAIFTASVFFFIYLYSFGLLTIRIDGKTIKFNWEKKMLLDFESYPDLDIKEISKIKVDITPQGSSTQLAIYSENRKIRLGNFENFKFLKDDLISFIYFLETAHVRHLRNLPIPTTDSWTEFRKKSYSKVLAVIYLLVVLVFIGIFIMASVQNGFKIKYLLWFLIVIPQFIMWFNLYKSKAADK
ncbi:hypothetical protein MKJ04_16625 [Pontibacter sp. E15-1]|uniref:hypothetical protein n=1 Tax=Pontibacter sp. E15-1 TaxID=2919918 RepID=UPI001F501A87|nr:hypothetical protein [Pontibacter sp. E15-1]MCJ8166472.1 hypothetical protein [Pontibacter sp. E15-1]